MGAGETMIDLTDPTTVRSRKPLLISHGGVSGPNTPKNSLPALQLAADHGYDMVEIDVQETQDGYPVLFHDRKLLETCGVDKTIRELTLTQAAAIRGQNHHRPITSLDQAFELCRSLNLGIILDLKIRDLPPSENFVKHISILLDKYHLVNHIIIFSSHPAIIRAFAETIFISAIVSTELKEEIAAPNKKVWFDFPENVTDRDVKIIHRADNLVFVTLKQSRYPADPLHPSAARDANRLINAGVDGFLIDSVYEALFKTV